MTSDNILIRRFKLATLIALGLIAFGWHNIARAAQLDCGVMADSLNPGDQYEFKLEIQSKKIRIEKGDDFCTESAKDWFKRQLILPAPARSSMPLPKSTASQQQEGNAGSSDNAPLPGQVMRQRPAPDLGLGLGSDGGAAPLPIQREFVKPKGVEEVPAVGVAPVTDETTMPGGQPDAVQVEEQPGGIVEDPVYGVAAPPPIDRKDILIKRCDRELVGFWSPGEHVIEGQKFWLSGVFTIDLNSDGRVDDVGFKIKAEGKVGNILNYFPSTEGRLSGKTVGSLKLDDDREIHRLCPGNITFERPGVAPGSKKKRPASQVLGGAKSQKTVKDGPVEESPVEEPIAEEPVAEIKPIIFIVGGISLILMLGGGIGLALAIRNMSSSKEDEYEDDDDDD